MIYSKNINTSKNWIEELELMGYKGKLLNILVDVIGEEGNLGIFYKFILDNENTITSKMSAVSRFIVFMKERNSYNNYNDFITDYINKKTTEKEVFKKLFGCELEDKIIEKVHVLLNSVNIKDFYNFVVTHRKYYNPKEIITLYTFKKNIN